MRLNCGHVASATSAGGTGVAVVDGYTRCHGCDTLDVLASLQWVTRLVAYHEGKRIVTWPGGRLMRITGSKVARGGLQWHVWATDPHGGRWLGQGPVESGNYLALRKIKGQ